MKNKINIPEIHSIYPCLWFDGQAREAAQFYSLIFGNAEILSDTPMVVTFSLNGQKFMGLNGGPLYKPNPSVSFYVICETMAETEQTWNKLVEGGMVMMPLDRYDWSEKYGWIQDKFGISWQLTYGKIEDVGQKFTPALMFTNDQKGRAEEAINFYASVFYPSDIIGIYRYSAYDQEIEGTIKNARFSLGHDMMMAMDSSYPHVFSFNEGISFVVDCETQQEIDYYWERLTDGGQESMCGWLKDRFGISWQIVPAILPRLLSDPEKAGRVTRVFMQMKKFDIQKLINA